MTARTHWRQRAACNGAVTADYDPFFPDDEDDPQALALARAYCDSCDAQAECLAYAVRTAQPHGIWGGHPKRVLRALVDQHRRGAPRDVFDPRGRANAAKTHCKRGHPFTARNTHITPDGKRQCRACQRASERRRARERRRSA